MFSKEDVMKYFGLGLVIGAVGFTLPGLVLRLFGVF